MNTAVPNELTPGNRNRAMLYPASSEMTSEMLVATTLMIRLFLIQTRNSVRKKRYR